MFCWFVCDGPLVLFCLVYLLRTIFSSFPLSLLSLLMLTNYFNQLKRILQVSEFWCTAKNANFTLHEGLENKVSLHGFKS